MPNVYTDIQAQLSQPFPAELIEFRQGDRGAALTYVELWPYIDRLDQAAPGQWELRDQAVTHSLVTEGYNGKPMVLQTVQVTLHIAGVTQTANSDPKTPTSAFAQAFKRAAAMHGLGRYLYKAPKLENAYRNNELVIDPSILLARCYAAWGLQLPEGFQVRESVPKRENSSRQESNGEQNPEQFKGKISVAQAKKLYTVGITDADILAMSTQDARDAVTDAFNGATDADIREKYLGAVVLTSAAALTRRKPW